MLKPYTITIAGTTYNCFVSSARAVSEKANNVDIQVPDTITFAEDNDAGLRYLLIATRFIDGLNPSFPDGIGDLTNVELDVTEARNLAAASTVREAMARAVTGASPLQYATGVTAGGIDMQRPLDYNSPVVRAATSGFYDQLAFNMISKWLPEVVRAESTEAQVSTLSQPPSQASVRITDFRG